MGAAITKLKGFVQTYVGYNFDQLSESEIEELTAYATLALQAVKWEIENDFDFASDENINRSYIGNIQSQLTYLAEGIIGFKELPLYNDAIPALLWWLLVEIYKLLNHLHDYFGNYFDYSQRMPGGYIEWFKAANKNLYDNIIPTLKENNADHDSISLMTNILTAGDNSETFSVRNWRQWNNLLLTVTIISNFLVNINTTDINLDLLKIFVASDFNGNQVYAYLVKYVEKYTLSEDSFQVQHQELIYLLKVFKQVRVDSPIPYDEQVQSLKLSVLESIEAEITYLEQREKVYIQNFKATSTESPSKFYFNVALTLAELMFFFRVMLEVKVIYTKFNSYLYEFISNHIRTAKADNISKKSMRNHFSNKPFPNRIVQNVKGWLVKMISHIDLYYSV